MACISMIVHVLDNTVAIASQELESNEEANNVVVDIPSIIPRVCSTSNYGNELHCGHKVCNDAP